MIPADPDAPRILFLCRGSARDGLGHVMRSRTAAEALLGRARVQMAVIGDRFVENLLAGRTVPWRIVTSERAALAEFEAFAPDVVVFDLLRFGAAGFRHVGRSAETVSLSPVFDRLAETGHFFHRTRALGDAIDSAGRRGAIHAGLEWAIVRPAARPIATDAYRHALEEEPLAVAISMGGADAGNKTLAVLDRLARSERPMLFWTLLGEGYAHSYEALVACVRAHPRHEIILAKTSDSMWRVMRGCALAVLAGGTVTYEAARAGLPSINLFEQEDHAFLVAELVERGAALRAGPSFDDAVVRAAALVAELERDRAELLAMHRRARGLIDGRGAARVADALLGIAARRRAAQGVADRESRGRAAVR